MKTIAAALLGMILMTPAWAGTTLKVATMAPDGTAWMREMRAGAEAVEKATEGRVKIKFYPGGVMGNHSSVMRKIRIGQLHGGAFTGGELATIYPDFQIYSLPFLFHSYAEVDHIRQTFDAELLSGIETAGWVSMGISEGGFAYLLSRDKVSGADDLQGMKVWVPEGDKIALTAFEKAGISPVTLPVPDVYTGLQTRLIDTVANTATGTIALQWHTAVKYLVNEPMSYVIGTMAFSSKALRKVSAEDVAILRRELGNALKALDRINRKDNEDAFAALQKLGITIVEPTPSDAAEWTAIAQDAIGSLRDEGLYTPALYDRIQRALTDYRTTATTAAR